MSKFKKDNTLIACPKCGCQAMQSWIEDMGQCGACGAREEKERVRNLDVSPASIASRLNTRFDRRPEWAKEDDERDHETRTLLQALADAQVKPVVFQTTLADPLRRLTNIAQVKRIPAEEIASTVRGFLYEFYAACAPPTEA